MKRPRSQSPDQASRTPGKLVEKQPVKLRPEGRRKQELFVELADVFVAGA